MNPNPNSNPHLDPNQVLARQDGLAGAAPEEAVAGVGGVILVPTRELCQQVDSSGG